MKDKLFSKSKFPIILGLTALFIALCAAFFSVYGIATLFAGASIAVMVMASSLEIGKLVGTTFLYRYWQKTQGFLKAYLMISIFVLMVITSLGIFGYLSAAYSKSSIEFKANQEKIEMITAQKTYFQDKITQSKSRIQTLTDIRKTQEDRLSQSLTNEFVVRNPLQLKQIQQQTMDMVAQTDKDVKTEQDKIQTSIDDIQKIDKQVNDMKFESAGKKDVQTFKFVADAVGVSLDTVARWFIISIIFVFDPLAICLILAYNVATFRREDERVYDGTVKEEPKYAELPVEREVLRDADPIISDEKMILRDSDPPINVEKEILKDAEPPVPPPAPGVPDDFSKKYFKL